MSLSKNRIFIGQSGLILDEVEFARRQREENLWDKETERRFIESIKQKAMEHAKKIIDEAKKEAEKIKKQGYEEGYRDGQKRGEEEIKKIKQDISTRLLKILEGIDKEKTKICSQFKEDLCQLISICVKKVLNLSFEENKKKVLLSFLDEILEVLEEKQKISLILSEKDREIIEDSLEQIRHKYQRINKWDIEWDCSLPQGAVVVETKDSKVETSYDDRIQEIMKILEKINLDTSS